MKLVLTVNIHVPKSVLAGGGGDWTVIKWKRGAK